MFNRYFRSFVPGFHLRPESDVPGFKLDDNSFRSIWPYGMPSRPLAPRSPDLALMGQILKSSTPSPQLFAHSTAPIGLAGFRATTEDDIPGFNLRLEDAVPGSLIESDSGVPRQGTPWFDGAFPQSELSTWLNKPSTMPLQWMALDPLTEQRTTPYAAPYVRGTSAPPDPSTDAPPDAEEWPFPDERPSSDTEEWPASDTEAQSQTRSTVPARAPSPQPAVQQATWRAQLPPPMNGQVNSEIGGHIKLEDSRGAPMALQSGIAAPWVKPIADNNFALANARNNAVREHALGNRSSSFGQEPVFGIGLNDVIARNDASATTGTGRSIVASFPPAAPANTPYQSYGTNGAQPTNFQYVGHPVGPMVANPYSVRNLPLQLANLSGVNNQGAASTSPSMSDAYPEPLMPGAQYAQVIENNAVLSNPRIDRTTERLLSILAETVESLGPGSGPIFGIQAHLEFANRVRALNIPGIRDEGVEQSFSLGDAARYGAAGSIRTDIVLRDPSGVPIAVYDLKTGNAKLTPSRVREIREAVGRPEIPVIELRYANESAVLR